MTPILQVKRVTKSFGRARALDGVSLGFERGRIYGLAGQNGAGKSTLVNLLCGVHRLDEGSMTLEGEPFAPSNPAEAEEAGLSVFHQEIPICPSLSVAHNVFLGARDLGLFPDWKARERQCEGWFEQWLGIRIDAERLLRDCTVAERQMTLLVRVLSRKARIIILDEPTTALTPLETARFFEVIRRLSEQGITFLFVSHFLDELMQLSDHIDVLRDGQVVGSLEKADFQAGHLASLIAGRTLDALADATAPDLGASAPRLEVLDLGRKGEFESVSFSVQAGEIFGIAGVQGSGRSEVARALFGAPPPEHGEVRVNGRAIRLRSVQDAMAAGIGYVPEDRQQYGLFRSLDVQTNLGLLRLGGPGGAGWLQRGRLRALAREMQARLQIRLPGLSAPIHSLSGGNQQKVLIARWLSIDPAVLVMNEPTRGVDVGAKDEICRVLRALSEAGCALVVASSDLDEILRLAHRILIMAGGRAVEEMAQRKATKAGLLQAMAAT